MSSPLRPHSASRSRNPDLFLPFSLKHLQSFFQFADLATRLRSQARKGELFCLLRSSQNGRSHGCCSNTLILSGEDPEEYEQIKEGWFTDFNPGSFAPLTLVLNVVKAQWFMLRNQRRCSEFEISLSEKSPIDWTDKDHRNLTNFMRYRTAAERGFNRCFNDLEKYRSTRVREHHSAERIRLKGLEYAAKIERDWLKKGASVQEPRPECPAEAPQPSTVADPPRPAKSKEPSEAGQPLTARFHLVTPPDFGPVQTTLRPTADRTWPS